MGVRPHIELRPVPEAYENGKQCAPAEQVQGRQSQVLKYFRLHGRVHLLHERDIYQVEEVQQSDPGDSGQEMDPAQQKLGRFRSGMGRHHERRCHFDEMVHGEFLRELTSLKNCGRRLIPSKSEASVYFGWIDVNWMALLLPKGFRLTISRLSFS